MLNDNDEEDIYLESEIQNLIVESASNTVEEPKIKPYSACTRLP